MLWEGATASIRQAWTSGHTAEATGRALWIGLSSITAAAKGLGKAGEAGAEIKIPRFAPGSRLAEVSRAAFRAADNVDDWTPTAKHLPNAAGRWNKWAQGVNIKGTVANALRSEGASFLPNIGGAADSLHRQNECRLHRRNQG
jgi:hypothetical protein